MFASLSQLASRSFMIGSVLPVLVTCVLGLYLFPDPLGDFGPFLTDPEAFDKIAYVAVAVWASAVVLSMASTAQYRLLQGYSWPISRLSCWKASELARFTEDSKSAENLEKKRDEGNGVAAAIEGELTLAYCKLRQEFPTKARLLPTRFGNRVRAFEDYAGIVYGVDAVMIWSSMSTVIPKEYLERIDNARANVDFLVNMIFMLLGLAALAAVRVVYLSLSATVPHEEFVKLVGACAILPLVARCAYRFSLTAIAPWGDLVKGAFDNYLPALAAQWGYEVPKTFAERRTFWEEVSQQVTFQIPVVPEKWHPKRSLPKQHLLSRPASLEPVGMNNRGRKVSHF
ncbi:hypothetical protein QN219_29345 [Sinorhizobium sp. 7-81]|uniref:hypothetical protein n=1 Tax=Sinorhizobium sp. 8-89 TaxID=3049089 RepID=UPI0024C37CB1|nr:hypothetical protein [Sinorhizobium sp. 8-89]MDK1494087.1 hypothetical protein [Sinorhizobium sp. 8-89]